MPGGLAGWEAVGLHALGSRKPTPVSGAEAGFSLPGGRVRGETQAFHKRGLCAGVILRVVQRDGKRPSSGGGRRGLRRGKRRLLGTVLCREEVRTGHSVSVGGWAEKL